jgi:sterol carrier protein 2
MAKQFIEGGLAECTLALGFEKMEKGSLGIKYTDRTNPMDKHAQAMIEMNGYEPKAPPAAQFFGNAGREHMEKYGTKPEHFAKIGWKNHKHSVNNPYSQFQDEYSLEDIQNSRMVFDPLTKLQCCPTSDGAGAAILASEEFVKQHGLQAKAVEILGQAMTTDYESTFSKSAIKLIGSDMTKKAAEKVYAQSGFGPENVDVVELHDCFSCNEMVTYEGLGLCPEGKGGEFVDSGANTYGGKVVVNPSGGLISKGHPLGATGLAQCAELNWQLRGEADARQVDGAKLALQHNLGLGGAAVVTMYRKAEIS